MIRDESRRRIFGLSPALFGSVLLGSVTLVASNLPGCGGEGPAPAARTVAETRPAEPEGESLTRTTTSGPVTVNVTLSPADPSLGDPLRLVLEVTSEQDVEVQMPAFGEALGRFEIVDFTPRRHTTPDGGTRSVQEYTLETPMSGPQVLPPLRVEFVDRRPNRGGEADPEEVHEILTEKIGFEVASVLPEGEVVDELRPPRGALPELVGTEAGRSIWPLAAGIVVVLLAPIAVIAIRRWVRLRRRRTAYDVAMARLVALERRGAPGPALADSWYVDLSGIIRRYLEDRFGLHAPERTTEEFLNEAGRSESLTQEHRALLRVFLQRCDRVKFAGYHPAEEESMDALGSARDFLQETQEGAPVLVET